MQGNQQKGIFSIENLKQKGAMAIGFFAKQYAKLIPSSKVIGISGEISRNTAIAACAQVLEDKFLTYKKIDSNEKKNNLEQADLAYDIFRIAPKFDKVLLEFNISNTNDINSLFNLIQPSTLIVTKISDNNFIQSSEQILQLYSNIFTKLPNDSSIILNGDDQLLKKLAEKNEINAIFYGTDNSVSHVWAGNIRTYNSQTIFELNYGVERVEVRSKLLGSHQIYPLLAAAALGISLNIPLIRIKKSLELVEPLDHVMQPLIGSYDSIIIDDTLNDNPLSLDEALYTLNEISARRRILVLGALHSEFENQEKLSKEIARRIFKDKFDLVLLIGKETEGIYEELIKLGFLSDRVSLSQSNSQVVGNLLGLLAKGDVVLIKGDYALHLEDVIKRITKAKRS